MTLMLRVPDLSLTLLAISLACYLVIDLNANPAVSSVLDLRLTLALPHIHHLLSQGLSSLSCAYQRDDHRIYCLHFHAILFMFPFCLEA